jgi:hypothetical protein
MGDKNRFLGLTCVEAIVMDLFELARYIEGHA